MVGTELVQGAFLAMRGERRDGFVRFSVQGELDLSTVPVFESSLACAEREGGTLILDLAGLKFTDSSGLHALSRAKRAEEHGRKLVIVNCRPAVQRMFGLTGNQHLLGSTLAAELIETSIDGWSPIALPVEGS